MTTLRLTVLLLIAGTLVLVVAQNLTPTLPLIFLGGSTLAYPIGVWLGVGWLLGSLTALGLAVLLGQSGVSADNRRGSAYKYRPRSFYEPPTGTAAATGDAGDTRSTARSRPSRVAASAAVPEVAYPDRPDMPRTPHPSDGDWQDWTHPTAADKWNDWTAVGQADQPKARTEVQSQSAASPSIPSPMAWWRGRQQRQQHQQQVEESLQDLDSGWDGVAQEGRRQGGSDVYDALDEINQGWDVVEPPPPRDFEVPQSPTQVYREGSVYSYRYRDSSESSQGRKDHIYGPPDQDSPRPDQPDQSGANQAETQPHPPEAADDRSTARAADLNDDDASLNPPEVAQDGVVEADYRVIIPPVRELDDDSRQEDDWEDEDDWGDGDQLPYR